MRLTTPEKWYMLFWIVAGIVALAPIYVMLYKILRRMP